MRKPNIKHKYLILFVLVFSSFLVLGVVFTPWTSPAFADDTVSISITWASTGGKSLNSRTFKDLTTNTTVAYIPSAISSAVTYSYNLSIGHRFQVGAEYSGRNSLGNSYTRYLVLYINGVVCSTNGSSPTPITDSDVITSSYSSDFYYYYFTVESSVTPSPSPTPTPTPTVSPFPDVTPFSTPSGSESVVFSGATYDPLQVHYIHDSFDTILRYNAESYLTQYNDTEFSDSYFIYKLNVSSASTPDEFSYNVLDVDIPYCFYGWNGSGGDGESTMFCSFKIGFEDNWVFPDNCSACVYLINSDDVPIAYIPLEKADIFNLWYCDNYSVAYSPFDHIEFKMLLASDSVTTLTVNSINLGSFIVSQDTVAYSSIAAEIDRIVNDVSVNGTQNAVIDWSKNAGDNVWKEIDTISAVLTPMFNATFGVIGGITYVQNVSPTIRAQGLILSHFWDALGSPFQNVIITLIILGSLATLGGFVGGVIAKKKGG